MSRVMSKTKPGFGLNAERSAKRSRAEMSCSRSVCV